MSDLIRLSPEELRGHATQIEAKAHDAEIFLGQVEKEVQNAISVWQGQASVAYLDKFRKIKNDLAKQLQETLRVMASDMRSTAQEIETRDREMAGALRNSMK